MIVIISVLVFMAIGMAILAIASKAAVFEHRDGDSAAIAQEHFVHAKQLRAWDC